MVKSKSFGARVFVVVNALVIGLLAASCLIPLIHVFAISLSDKSSASGGLVTLWPVNFTLESYKYVINRAPFWTAMLVSLKRVLVGVSLNMFFCIICAYPLSKETNQFRARTAYAWYFFITMLISGGMIPLYMVINLTGLKGTFWSLVIPGAVPVYNIILLLNFFRQTPRELEEAAIMDGASQWRILWRFAEILRSDVVADFCNKQSIAANPRLIRTQNLRARHRRPVLHCVSLERMVQRHHLQQRSGAISFAELHANHRH